METMGERLLALRKKKGLTQEDLAGELMVSRQSVSNWELDKTLPDTDKLFALAKIYEISLDYMVFGKQAEEEKEKQVSEEISDNGKVGHLFRMLHMAGLVFCIVLTVICVVFTIDLFSGFATDSDKMNSDIAIIDQVIEQYSYVEVSKFDSMGNYAKDRVWIDSRNLSEGDAIFCFSDIGNPKKMKFEYYSKTLILPFAITCLFIFLSGILGYSYYQNLKRNKSGSVNK